MRQSIGWLAAVISSGVVLAACGGSASRHQAGDTRIRLDQSIGGVALREHRSDVERELGHGEVLRTEDQQPPEPRLHFERVLYQNGLEVGYVSRSASSRSRAQGQVVYLLTHSPRFRTSEGVHVGSSAAELQTIRDVTCGNVLGLDCQHGGHVHNEPGTFFKLSGPGGAVARIAIAFSD